MIMSDGELYAMQKDAIERARKTSQCAKPSPAKSPLSSDSLIFLCVLLILITDGCNDRILLALLAFLAFS